jgi:hypothetical protein
MRRTGVAVVGIALAVALAAPAGAQEPGVVIDPDSPSAKEYALPFESERRNADPEQGPSARIVPGARSSPLFGAGITSGDAPGSRDRGEREAKDAETERTPGAGERTPGAGASDGDSAVVRAAATNPGAPPAGAGDSLAIVGIGLGVLLIGGLAGVLWRRRA